MHYIMNREEPFVLTISREVGSGGHTVGGILAGKLGARYCDKQLLGALEKQFNLSAGAIEKLKGEKQSWLADFVSMISPMPSARMLGLDPRVTQEFRIDVTTNEIYKAEEEILKGFAEMGSCVIAGRSGRWDPVSSPAVPVSMSSRTTPMRCMSSLPRRCPTASNASCGSRA